MAVFPDRIVLKNSTDSQALIEDAIRNGGTDSIVVGEVVVGVSPGNAKFYTKASDGTIVVLGNTQSTISDLNDVNLDPMATDGQVLVYNSVSGKWEAGDGIASVTSINGGTFGSGV